MNILYINHYAGSIHHGMEYRPYYLAREWVRMGHKVTIIASNISHIRAKNMDIPKGSDYLEENIDGIRYIWCRTPPYSGNGIKRVINIFTFLYRLKARLPKLVKQAKPDMIIASSTYPFDTKIAAKFARKTKACFVYEVHDLWPLTPIELSGMSKNHPFIWLMQKAEDFGYKNADKVVSLLPKAKAYMLEHGMAEDKFVYIPNGVSVADWRQSTATIPIAHKAAISKIKQEYKFVLGYAGSMGEANALKFFIQAMKELPEFAAILVGDGILRDALIKSLQEENITNVFFLPAIKKAEVPDLLSYMDALYIGWNNLPIYRFGICPNKLFDYMLAAKPVIHSVTAGNDLVADAHCGISIPAEDVSHIVGAIKTLAKQTAEDRTWLGQNGNKYVIQHHDYQVLARRFLIECGVEHA